MSLYNMVNGVSPAAFFVLPMLGEKHPQDYPRFRDCFLSDEEHPEYDGHIHLYTRVGGNNRGCGFGEEELHTHPNYVTTFDDSFDNTFATYVFSVPEEWKADYDKFVSGDIKGFSPEYQARCRAVFPKLKETFDKLWNDDPGEGTPASDPPPAP